MGHTWCPGQFGQMGSTEVDMKLRDPGDRFALLQIDTQKEQERSDKN